MPHHGGGHHGGGHHGGGHHGHHGGIGIGFGHHHHHHIHHATPAQIGPPPVFHHHHHRHHHNRIWYPSMGPVIVVGGGGYNNWGGGYYGGYRGYGGYASVNPVYYDATHWRVSKSAGQWLLGGAALAMVISFCQFVSGLVTYNELNSPKIGSWWVAMFIFAASASIVGYLQKYNSLSMLQVCVMLSTFAFILCLSGISVDGSASSLANGLETCWDASDSNMHGDYNYYDNTFSCAWASSNYDCACYSSYGLGQCVYYRGSMAQKSCAALMHTFPIQAKVVVAFDTLALLLIMFLMIFTCCACRCPANCGVEAQTKEWAMEMTNTTANNGIVNGGAGFTSVGSPLHQIPPAPGYSNYPNNNGFISAPPAPPAPPTPTPGYNNYPNNNGFMPVSSAPVGEAEFYPPPQHSLSGIFPTVSAVPAVPVVPVEHNSAPMMYSPSAPPMFVSPAAVFPTSPAAQEAAVPIASNVMIMPSQAPFGSASSQPAVVSPTYGQGPTADSSNI